MNGNSGSIFAPILLVLGLLHGAPALTAEANLPALMVEEVAVTDVGTYAALIQDINTQMRERHAVPLFLRAYQAHALGSPGGAVFVLSPAASFASLSGNIQRFAADAEMAVLRKDLFAAATPGPAAYLKAVRFDGTNTPGWLNNTYVSTRDEAALLAKASELAALSVGQGRAAAFINVFRVVSGTAAYTHLVSVNVAAPGDLAALLDKMAAAAWTLVPPNEIISSAIYAELTP